MQPTISSPTPENEEESYNQLTLIVLSKINADAQSSHGVTRKDISALLSERGYDLSESKVRALLNALKFAGFIQSQRFYYNISPLGVQFLTLSSME